MYSAAGEKFLEFTYSIGEKISFLPLYIGENVGILPLIRAPQVRKFWTSGQGGLVRNAPLSPDLVSKEGGFEHGIELID